MNPIKKLLDGLVQQFRNLVDRVNKTLNVAFPKTETKYTVIALWIALMLFIAYTIGVIDMGIWTGEYTIPAMFRNYLAHERKSFPWLYWGLFVLIATIVAYVYLVKLTSGDTGRGFSLSGSNVYGSAREINREELNEVADIETKYGAMNTILGQLDLTEDRLITAKANPNSNGNIAIFGPPGSGKSFCFVKPTILQCIRRGESCICTDTKGELWADTVEFARKHGYVVRRVDLKDPAYSDGWHVLKEMRHDDMRAMIMSQIIMKNTGQEKDIHADAEAALLRAICLYIERNPDIPEDQKSLYAAYSLLLGAGGAEELDTKFKAIQFDPELKPAWEAYASFIQGSQNLRGNIITGLANRLSVLSSPPVREMTSTDDIDLTELGRRPTILYLVCSDQHETMRFLASLLYSYAFLDLVELADSQMSRKLPVPVTFLMEEFANLGEVPNITKYLSTCRSRAINIMLVVQSLAQLREVYGDNNTDVMLATCATHLCIGYNDRSTAEYFEWRSGEASINVRTEQHQYGESPVMIGKNYSTGEGRRNYFTSHELMTIPRGEIYIVWQRYNCLKAKTFGINRHPATLMGEMHTISTEVKVRLDNRIAKDYIRQKEEERIARYNEWVESGGNPWQGYTKPDPEFNGPARGTPLPEIIPYPELEKEALEYGTANKQELFERITEEIQEEEPTAPPAIDTKGAIVLDDVAWENSDKGDDEDDEDDVASDAPIELPPKTDAAPAETPAAPPIQPDPIEPFDPPKAPKPIELFDPPKAPKPNPAPQQEIKAAVSEAKGVTEAGALARIGATQPKKEPAQPTPPAKSGNAPATKKPVQNVPAPSPTGQPAGKAGANNSQKPAPTKQPVQKRPATGTGGNTTPAAGKGTGQQKRPPEPPVILPGKERSLEEMFPENTECDESGLRSFAANDLGPKSLEAGATMRLRRPQNPNSNAPGQKKN